jgi:hypothetical protein
MTKSTFLQILFEAIYRVICEVTRVLPGFKRLLYLCKWRQVMAAGAIADSPAAGQIEMGRGPNDYYSNGIGRAKLTSRQLQRRTQVAK